MEMCKTCNLPYKLYKPYMGEMCDFGGDHSDLNTALRKRFKAPKNNPQTTGTSPIEPNTELREKVRLITQGWLGSTLIEYDVIPTVGSLSWRTRKINEELLDLLAHQQSQVLQEVLDMPELQRKPVQWDDYKDNVNVAEAANKTRAAIREAIKLKINELEKTDDN